jgi:hypothetical protein
METTLITSGALPAGYRIIPLMALDDEGTNGKNISSRSGLGRPAVDCGATAGQTLKQRIADCLKLNTTTASWDGTSFGASGESVWKLVTRTGTLEMWLDTRTGHLWSDTIATTNWCNASGNTLVETDASVNCLTAGTNVTCVGKNLMNITGIVWRLPTRNDYLQGDLDGLRFVLKESDTTGFWTATMNSVSFGRSEAWVYQQRQGTLESAALGNDHQVRCIGDATI